jgi:hypothetical protein
MQRPTKRLPAFSFVALTLLVVTVPQCDIALSASMQEEKPPVLKPTRRWFGDPGGSAGPTRPKEAGERDGCGGAVGTVFGGPNGYHFINTVSRCVGEAEKCPSEEGNNWLVDACRSIPEYTETCKKRDKCDQGLTCKVQRASGEMVNCTRVVRLTRAGGAQCGEGQSECFCIGAEVPNGAQLECSCGCL